MSALFTPIKLRDLTLANRIMVAPMCQYSSVDGEANDWHFTHINSLALSGAAISRMTFQSSATLSSVSLR